MRLSELRYENIVRPGENHFYMRGDVSDALTMVGSQQGLNDIVEGLIKDFGDMECSVHKDKGDAWFDRVKYHDEQWQKAHEEFMDMKGRWCEAHGSD